MIVACWSGPRNISTALMRSWSSRHDTFVTDEPFYAYYLKETKLKHPMYEEIINHYSSNYNQIVSDLISKIPEGKKIWYQKHMAHHILDLTNIEWIANCENCILMRHPKEVISSYTKKNELNSVEDLGYSQQYEIMKFLKKLNKPYIIIDSSELLKNPEKSLSTWCKKMNIKFYKSMLSWEKGNNIYDGIWWKSWYDNVINTTGFQKFEKKDITIENKYDSIYNESMKYYNYLKENKE
jgi:hypothetical protein